MVRVTSAVAEGRVGNVSPEKRFWCRDGSWLTNLEELESALEVMTEDTFRYHVNETKNDFSRWVQDVIGDEKLARDLARSLNRRQAARNVAARLMWLKAKI